MIIYSERAYDTDYFTVATNLFAVDSKKPVWSNVSQVKVTGMRRGAVNDFVPILVNVMVANQLFN